MSEIMNQHRQFCEYSLVFKGNSKRTIKWLDEVMRYFVNATGVEDVKNIDRTMVENYIMRGRLDKNWSAKTIRTRISALKLFLDWCVRQGQIEVNPLVGIELPKLPKKIPRHLTKDDAFELLEWTQNYRYAYQFERRRAVAIVSLFVFLDYTRRSTRLCTTG